MTRKMLAEGKILRTMIRDHELKGQLLKATTAFERAVRADEREACIVTYYDWERRRENASWPFPAYIQ